MDGIILQGEDSDKSAKGKWIKCKICKQKFKFTDDNIRSLWKLNKLECPTCKGEYCVLPKTERELRVLQDKYFDSGRKDIYMNKMFYILVDYTMSILKKKMGGKLKFLEGHVEEKATDAVSLLLERYSDPEFKITKSFGKFMEFKLKERLYAKKYRDLDTDTLDYEHKDGNFVEYEDNKGEDDLNKISNEGNEEELVEFLYNTILNHDNIIKSNYSLNVKQEFIRQFALHEYLKGGAKQGQDRMNWVFNTLGVKDESKVSSLRTINSIQSILLNWNGFTSTIHILDKIKKEN